MKKIIIYLLVIILWAFVLYFSTYKHVINWADIIIWIIAGYGVSYIAEILNDITDQKIRRLM